MIILGVIPIVISTPNLEVILITYRSTLLKVIPIIIHFPFIYFLIILVILSLFINHIAAWMLKEYQF